MDFGSLPQRSAGQLPQAFNTLQMIVDLFKKGVLARKLPEVDNPRLQRQFSELGTLTSSVNDLINEEHGPQERLLAIKKTLIEARDSTKRKELVAVVTDIDNKLVAQHAQGETLMGEIQQTTDHLWELITRVAMAQQALTPQELDRLQGATQALREKIEPFIFNYKRLASQIKDVAVDTEKATGMPVQLAQPAAPTPGQRQP